MLSKNFNFLLTIIKKCINYSFQLFLYLLANNINKDKNIWIFGSWFGNKYEDNSMNLFEYINKNHSQIRAIWVTKNKTLLHQIKEKGYEVYYYYDPRIYIISLKASVSIFVQTNENDNLLFLNNKKTKLIQLWHGSPIKKIVYDDIVSISTKSNLRIFLTNIKEKILPFLNEEYDLIIARSKEDQKIFKSAFRNNNVVVTGYPRNDAFFSKNTYNSLQTNIIYLPTFRGQVGSTIDLFSHYNFDFDLWKEYLRKNNIILNIKMHPVNKLSEEIQNKFEKIENIKFIVESDLFKILPNMDILITDYSSIFFDFLLTDKPIIFSPFDYEAYSQKDRSFYYDYEDITPGPKCNDWNEVLEHTKIFIDNPDLYAQERKDTKQTFHTYFDKSSERVYHEILNLIHN